MSTLDQARAVADAVLYEGYLLFPYTRSSLKNRSRFQFGVIMPHGYADPSEPTAMDTTLLCRRENAGAQIEITARFLQFDQSATEREAVMHTDLQDAVRRLPFRFDNLHGLLTCSVVADGDYLRVTVLLENKSRIDANADRNQALSRAFIGAHVLATMQGGAFISLLDVPEPAREAASRCENRRLYPVLVGDEEEDAQTSPAVLSSPIILYDFPKISPQSTVPTFDGTEIDELLMLSVAAMTDEEKREAREDERARAILDHAERRGIVEGAHVRIHPKRRADAFDMFAEGQTARVKALHEDVDGRRYVAVIFDADPASDLHEWYGRSFFYEPDEVELL